jgi:MSHA type pilus biogenesis protein MshL
MLKSRISLAEEAKNMKRSHSKRHIQLLVLLVLAVGILPACASGGQSGPEATSTPPPAAPPTWGEQQDSAWGPAPTMSEAPALALEETLDDSGYDPNKTYDLTVRDTDVRAVLLAIARDSDLSIVIEPDVTGTVTHDIKGVSLPVLLDSLLSPLELEYRVESNVIKVRGRTMETRLFFLDIVQTDRTGSRSIGVTTGGQSGGGLTGGNGGAGGGAGIGGVGGVGGGSGGGNASVQSNDPTFIWEQIAEGVGFLMGGGFGGSFGGGALDPLNRSRRGGLGGFGGGFGGGVNGDGPSMHVNRAAGTIMVRHYTDVLDEIGEYLDSIEKIAQRQVLIEAQIVEVVMHDNFSAGIDWSMAFEDLGLSLGQNVGAGGINVFQAAVSRGNFNAVIGAFSNQGEVNVLSSPSVVTLNNQMALLSVGTQEVFFTTQTVFNGQGNLAQTITTPGTVTNGVILSVTPQVAADGWVTMSVQPAVTNLAGFETSPNGDRFPRMDVRVSDHVIRVPEGETIFIGGLLEDVMSDDETKTPVLGDIPILGSLFKRQDKESRKADLIVMITPTILNEDRIRELVRDQRQRLEMRRRAKAGGRAGQ